MDFISKIPAWPFTIIAALIGILGAFYLQHHKMRRNASASFRKAILSELEGFFPTTSNWPRDIGSKLIGTLPKIESAAKEFESYLPFYRKKAFLMALNRYQQCCCETTWDKCAAYAMYTSMRKPGEISPKEEFTGSVEGLLSFSKQIKHITIALKGRKTTAVSKFIAPLQVCRYFKSHFTQFCAPYACR